jgi:ABC-type transport system substrate-binding protein
MIAAACGGDDDDDAAGETAGEGTGGTDTAGTSETGGVVNTVPPSDKEPVPGGTLRYGLETDTDGLNPAENNFAVAANQMGVAVFDPLVAVAADGSWVPYLAESLTPNEDFTEWTITAREGVTFHDGEPFNADAIVAGVEGLLAGALPSLAVRPTLDPDMPVEKIDEMSVLVRTNEPASWFPYALVGQLGMVPSPKWLAEAKENPDLNQQPVGTGPFVYESRVPDGSTKFVRNEDYWAGEVYLDAVEFFPVDDSARRADQLLAGDLDEMHTTTANDIVRMREDGSIEMTEENLGEESFVMINSSQPPFDDIRVREALTLTTPRDRYIEVIGEGILEGADQMFHPTDPFYNPDVTQAADDPAAAQPLLAEYCAENPVDADGNPLCIDGRVQITLTFQTAGEVQNTIMALLSAGWSEGGFDVELDDVPQDSYIVQIAGGDWQVNTWRQFGAPDPGADEIWMRCSTIGGFSLNWPRLCDEDRDALFEAEGSLEGDERIAVWQDVVENVNQAYTYVFLTHTLWANATGSNVENICGAVSPEGEPLQCSRNGWHRLDQIWLDG